MEPEIIDLDLLFSATAQVDTSDLSALTLFAGSTGANYSDQLDDSFSFSRSGTNIEVNGIDFVYSGGVPTAGAVTGMLVKVGNATAYYFGTLSGDPADGIALSVFDTADPLALAQALFAGNDGINGSSFRDVIYGFSGDDQIVGNSGKDRLYGGEGNDQILGGTQKDKLYGGNGDDWLAGHTGNDKLFGGAGFDVANFSGTFSPVKINFSKGKTVKAKVGIDEVDKLKGIEGALGGLSDDKFIGNKADNTFGGDSGDDILKGKGGNDILVGGWGSDTLVGGKGADVFLFDKPPEGSGWRDVDKIKDFGVGQDSIHLDQHAFGMLDPGTLSADHFYAAPGAFAGVGETYIVYDTSNGALYYDASGDGSGHVVQIAKLKGAPTLDASDIFVIDYIDDLI